MAHYTGPELIESTVKKTHWSNKLLLLASFFTCFFRPLVHLCIELSTASIPVIPSNSIFLNSCLSFPCHLSLGSDDYHCCLSLKVYPSEIKGFSYETANGELKNV